MAISPQYENFSFVGSKEDSKAVWERSWFLTNHLATPKINRSKLFTRYKRKCTTTTVRQKRSKIITYGVVIFLLVALVIGLSVGLHVQKKAEKADKNEKLEASNGVQLSDENELAKMDKNVSAVASTSDLHTETADGTIIEQTPEEKPQKPCSGDSKCRSQW